MDPMKAKEIKELNDLLAFNSGPQIVINPGIISREEFHGMALPSGHLMNPELDPE